MHKYLDIYVPILVRQCAAVAQSVERRTLKAFVYILWRVRARPRVNFLFFLISVIQATKRYAIAWSLFLAIKNEMETTYCVRFALILSYYLYNCV